MPNTPLKPVISTDADGNETYYPSVSAAAAAIGAYQSQISNAIVTGYRCRGFYWRKADEPCRSEKIS